MCLSNREVQEKSARLLKGVRNYLGQRNAFQGRRFGEEYRSVIYVRLSFFSWLDVSITTISLERIHCTYLFGSCFPYGLAVLLCLLQKVI